MFDNPYKLESAGQEKSAKGRNYTAPGKELRDVFEKYLDFSKKQDGDKLYDCIERNDLYDGATGLLKGIQPAIAEAHGLLMAREFSMKELHYAGFFLSAVYNKSDEKDIVYSLEIETPNLAYRLSRDRAFINKGNGYRDSGTNAKGIIINYCENKKFNCVMAGYFAKGPIITYGATAHATSYDDDNDCGETSPLKISLTDRLHINVLQHCLIIDEGIYLTRGPDTWPPCHLLSKKEVSKFPELRAYVDNLKSQFERGRNDHQLVLETIRKLGYKPHMKIMRDIADILRRAGKNV